MSKLLQKKNIYYFDLCVPEFEKLPFIIFWALFFIKAEKQILNMSYILNLFKYSENQTG